jgi:hypothetical protein
MLQRISTGKISLRIMNMKATVSSQLIASPSLSLHGLNALNYGRQNKRHV